MDPELPPPRPKQEIYEELYQWCVDHSVPKKRYRPKVDRGPIATGDVISKCDTWSIPLKRKRYIPPRKDPTSWVYKLKHLVRPGALTYVISDNISTMAEPMPRRIYVRPEDNPSDWAYKLKHLCTPASLRYVASARILELCRQQKRWIYRRPRRRPASGVRRRALKAKARKRTCKLALPKVRNPLPLRDWIYTINPQALKFKVTKRLRKLARHKTHEYALEGWHERCGSELPPSAIKKKRRR